MKTTQESTNQYAEGMIHWLWEHGYLSIEFQDSRIGYITVQIDRDLFPKEALT